MVSAGTTESQCAAAGLRECCGAGVCDGAVVCVVVAVVVDRGIRAGEGDAAGRAECHGPIEGKRAGTNGDAVRTGGTGGGAKTAIGIDAKRAGGDRGISRKGICICENKVSGTGFGEVASTAENARLNGGSRRDVKAEITGCLGECR